MFNVIKAGKSRRMWKQNRAEFDSIRSNCYWGHALRWSCKYNLVYERSGNKGYFLTTKIILFFFFKLGVGTNRR